MAQAALLLPVFHCSDKARQGGGYPLQAVFLGDALHRKPLKTLAQVTLIRPGHADNQRLRKAFAQIASQFRHAVRAGTHAMEQQHQLHRAGRLLNHDVVAHVFSPELPARLDGAPVLNDGRAMGRV
jgi:hypothetical protein